MTFLPNVRSQFEATAHQNSKKEALASSFDIFLVSMLVLFNVSLISIIFMPSPTFTFWPSNAILLVVLLWSTGDWTKYGTILLGGGSAIALANVAVGYDLAFSVILSLGHVLEVATALLFLGLYQDDEYDLACIGD